MASTNHPFFFPLLKKLIIVTLRKHNTNKITGKDKEQISQISGIKKSYCERILVSGVYKSKVGQAPIGEYTLSKLVRCLPSEWKYDSWDMFCFKEQKKMKDTALISDLTDNHFYLLSEDHQKRIRDEIECRADSYIQELHAQDEIQRPKVKSVEAPSEPLQLAKDDSTNKTPLEDPLPSSYEKHNIPKSSARWFSLRILGSLMFFVFMGVLLWNYAPIGSSSNNRNEKEEIEQVIRKALQLEFSAYKAVPIDKNCCDTMNYSRNCMTPCLKKVRKSYMPYLDSLREYMGKELIAKIRGVVGGSVWKGWTLQNQYNRSIMTISTVENINIVSDSSIAYAETRENCSIKWFDIELGEYVYYYDSPDTYRYTLKKEDGQNWKITDVEDNTSGRIIRTALICCNLQEGLVDAPTTQERILKALNGADLNLALKYFQCFYKHKDEPIPDKVHTTYIELKYLYKNLNTHVIKSQEFNKEKIELVKKFSKWFKTYDMISLES